MAQDCKKDETTENDEYAEEEKNEPPSCKRSTMMALAGRIGHAGAVRRVINKSNLKDEEKEPRLHADSCCNNIVLGSGWMVSEKSLITVSMSGFEINMDLTDMPLVSGATAVQLQDGAHVVLIANNAAHLGCGDSIMSDPQMEHSGHLANDRPCRETLETFCIPKQKMSWSFPWRCMMEFVP